MGFFRRCPSPAWLKPRRSRSCTNVCDTPNNSSFRTLDDSTGDKFADLRGKGPSSNLKLPEFTTYQSAGKSNTEAPWHLPPLPSTPPLPFMAGTSQKRPPPSPAVDSNRLPPPPPLPGFGATDNLPSHTRKKSQQASTLLPGVHGTSSSSGASVPQTPPPVPPPRCVEVQLVSALTGDSVVQICLPSTSTVALLKLEVGRATGKSAFALHFLHADGCNAAECCLHDWDLLERVFGDSKKATLSFVVGESGLGPQSRALPFDSRERDYLPESGLVDSAVGL